MSKKKQMYPKSLIVKGYTEANSEPYFSAYVEGELEDSALSDGDEVAVYTYSGTVKVRKTISLE